jgi:hypothetical protein
VKINWLGRLPNEYFRKVTLQHSVPFFSASILALTGLISAE